MFKLKTLKPYCLMYRNINSEPLLKCYQLQQVIQMNHRGKH